MANRLTGEQVLEMQSKGLNINEIQTLATQKGYEMPDNRNFTEKLAPALDMVFGGGKVGEAIGTQIAKARATPEEKQFITPGPSAGEVAGSALQSAALFTPVGKLAGGITAGARSLGMKTGVSALGRVGAGAVAGEAFDVAQNLQEGETGAEALKPGVGTILGASIPAMGVVTRGFGRGAQKAGEKIQFGVIKPSIADVKDGFNIANVNKYQLGGSLSQTFEKTQSKLNDLSKQLTSKIESSKTPVNLDDIFANTLKRVTGNKIESFGSNKGLENALESLRSEITTVAGKNGLVNLAEAQSIKRAAGHLGAWKYGMTDPESKAAERVYNVFYNEIKTAIEKSAPAGVKEINKQISELIPISNAVIRRIPIAERNRGMSLTDVIALTGATIEPRALAVSVLNFLQKSGKAGEVLQKTGGAVSKVKAPIAGAPVTKIGATILPRNE